MHGKIVQVDWQEDATTLKGMYLGEKDATVRSRLHLLWLVRQGQQVKQATATLGVHPRTAQQWLAWYREGGVDLVRVKKGGNAQGSPCRLTSQQQHRLVAHAASEGFRSGLDAVQWVSHQFGVVYSLKGMYGLLNRLHIDKKVPRPMNVKADHETQEAYKKGG